MTEASERMVTLHERMVHLIEQLGMPVSEVALVINKYVKALLRALVESGMDMNFRSSTPNHGPSEWIRRRQTPRSPWIVS